MNETSLREQELHGFVYDDWESHHLLRVQYPLWWSSRATNMYKKAILIRTKDELILNVTSVFLGNRNK